MNVLALVSGGKDSIFNMALCVSMGHRIVCLGNLYAPIELDSFMYQTVGGDVVPLIADCLGLELVRFSLVDGGDGMDKLHDLLVECKRKYPEINAVSVGAIRSNYQRTRIESVAVPLGIVPLCYMWNQSQNKLLECMLQFNMQIQIVKVACYALNVDHLRLVDGELLKQFGKLYQQFGMNVCGEGGEYESLVFNCPLYRNGSVRIVNQEQVHRVQEGEVCYLNFRDGALSGPTIGQYIPLNLDSFDGQELDLIQDLKLKFFLKAVSDQVPARLSGKDVLKNANTISQASTKKQGNWLSVTGLKGDAQCTSQLRQLLESDYEFVMVNLQLRSLSSNFVIVNDVYKQLFQMNSFAEGQEPPCRLCIGYKDLNNDIAIDALAYKRNRQELSKYSKVHVQSRSFWAPSNIGPYSQLIIVPSSLDGFVLQYGRVFVAGQIGLIPETMVLASSLEDQSRLAMRHVQQILFTGLQDGNVEEMLPQTRLAVCITYTTSLEELVKVQTQGLVEHNALQFGVVVDELPIGAKVEFVAEAIPLDLLFVERLDNALQDQLEVLEQEGKGFVAALANEAVNLISSTAGVTCVQQLKWNGHSYMHCYFGNDDLVDLDLLLSSVNTILQITLYQTHPVQVIGQVIEFVGIQTCRQLCGPDSKPYKWAMLVKHSHCSLIRLSSITVLSEKTEELDANLQNVLKQRALQSIVDVDFVPVLRYDLNLYKDNIVSVLQDWKADQYMMVSSQRAVDAIALTNYNPKAQIKCMIVGQKTASKLQGLSDKYLIYHVANNAVELAAHIKDSLQNDVYIHFFCGNTRRDTLLNMLSEAEFIVTEVLTYFSTPIQQTYRPQIRSIVVVMSPLGVKSQIDQIRQAIKQPHFVAIGQTTASALAEFNVLNEHITVAQSPSQAEIVKAIGYLLDQN